MLSKGKIKLLLSLQKRKNREDERLFIIEGDKIVREVLSSGLKVISLIAKPEFINGLTNDQLSICEEVIPVSYEELKKVSSLTTPHNAMVVVAMEENTSPALPADGEYFVALDFIQDPGNLGTIIRAAAWFGIRSVICSDNCVDVYNPKVIQATMGAFLSVTVRYTPMIDYLSLCSGNGIRIYGTLLEGNSLYDVSPEKRGIILIGNESKGISGDLLPFVSDRVTIPSFSISGKGIESLNAGMATSIVLSEFARKKTE